MIAVILISVLFFFEAWLEVAVIKTKADQVDQAWNHKEHFRSAVYAGLLIAIACAFVIWQKDYWAILPIVISRRIFFDFVLAIMRKRPLSKYEGNDWWEGKLKAIFHNRLIELGVEVALFSVYFFINPK